MILLNLHLHNFNSRFATCLDDVFVDAPMVQVAIKCHCFIDYLLLYLYIVIFKTTMNITSKYETLNASQLLLVSFVFIARFKNYPY